MRYTTQSFIEKAKSIHGDKYDYSQSKYINSVTKIKIICNKCGSVWGSLPHNHFAGRGCKNCQYQNLLQNQVTSHEQFVAKARKIHGYKFDYIENYKGARTKITIRCRECNTTFLQRAGSHLEGTGCKKCFYQNNPTNNQGLSIDEFERQCRSIHYNKYQYFQDYTSGRKKIKIRCIKHNHIFFQNAEAHRLKRQGCPICNFSKGELRIFDILSLKKIKFEQQYKVNTHFGKCLFLDFYLAQCRLAIEYDGRQHFECIPCWGGEEKYRRQVISDLRKNIYCLENNIRLVRIPYTEFDNIESILENINE